MIGGTGRHAKVEALFAPQEDSGMGRARYVEGVQREWIRNMYQALNHFYEAHCEYTEVMHLKYGSCPAVLVPNKRFFKHMPHLWAGLNDIVIHIDLPTWLPGECCKGSHIILRADRDIKITDKPVEDKWDTQYGPSLSVCVQHVIYPMTLNLKVHHLEDIVDKSGDVTMRLTRPCHRGAMEAQSEAFKERAAQHKRDLAGYRSKKESAWTECSDDWRPKVLDVETRTVVAGQGAKREKKRTVALKDMILEVDEDLLQVIEGGKEVSEPICQIQSRTPILDGRLHKALMNLLDIRVHYGVCSSWHKRKRRCLRATGKPTRP